MKNTLVHQPSLISKKTKEKIYNMIIDKTKDTKLETPAKAVVTFGKILSEIHIC